MEKEVITTKATVQEVLDFVRNLPKQDKMDKRMAWTIATSFARVYRDTAVPSDDWASISVSSNDLERRLDEFSRRNRTTFKNPTTTIAAYKTRARRALKLYTENKNNPKPKDSYLAVPIPSGSPEISFTIEQLKRQVDILERYIDSLAAIIEQNTNQKGGSMD